MISTSYLVQNVVSGLLSAPAALSANEQLYSTFITGFPAFVTEVPQALRLLAKQRYSRFTRRERCTRDCVGPMDQSLQPDSFQ